jgi:hypothetical protein
MEVPQDIIDLIKETRLQNERNIERAKHNLQVIYNFEKLLGLKPNNSIEMLKDKKATSYFAYPDVVKLRAVELKSVNPRISCRLIMYELIKEYGSANVPHNTSTIWNWLNEGKDIRSYKRPTLVLQEDDPTPQNIQTEEPSLQEVLDACSPGKSEMVVVDAFLKTHFDKVDKELSDKATYEASRKKSHRRVSSLDSDVMGKAEELCKTTLTYKEIHELLIKEFGIERVTKHSTNIANWCHLNKWERGRVNTNKKKAAPEVIARAQELCERIEEPLTYPQVHRILKLEFGNKAPKTYGNIERWVKMYGWEKVNPRGNRRETKEVVLDEFGRDGRAKIPEKILRRAEELCKIESPPITFKEIYETLQQEFGNKAPNSVSLIQHWNKRYNWGKASAVGCKLDRKIQIAKNNQNTPTRIRIDMPQLNTISTPDKLYRLITAGSLGVILNKEDSEIARMANLCGWPRFQGRFIVEKLPKEHRDTVINFFIASKDNNDGTLQQTG